MPFTYLPNPEREIEIVNGILEKIEYTSRKVGERKFENMNFRIHGRIENFSFEVPWEEDPLAFKIGENVKVSIDEKLSKLFIKVAGIEILPERNQNPYYRAIQGYLID